MQTHTSFPFTGHGSKMKTLKILGRPKHFFVAKQFSPD